VTTKARRGVTLAAIAILGAAPLVYRAFRSTGRAHPQATSSGEASSHPAAEVASKAPSGEAAADVEDEAPAGGERLAGLVEDASGGIVAGARIVVVSSGAEPRALFAAMSGDVGRFELSVPAGWVRLAASAPGYAPGAVETRAPDAQVRLVLAPGATLGGRVVQEGGGEPVAGVAVTAVAVSGDSTPQTTRSGPDGVFQLTELAPGAYQLAAAGESWRSEPQWATAVLGAPLTTLAITVSRATTVAGAVEVDGRPCAGAFVQLEGRAPATGAADGAGQVRIEGVAPGRYALTVTCNGATPLRETVQVAAGEAPRAWRLDRGLAVTGTVVTAGGAPVAGAGINVSAAQTSARAGAASRCVSDAVGRFSCGGLVPGAYGCFADRSGAPISDTATVTLAAGAPAAPVSLVVRPTGAVQVKVLRPDGTPADGVTVSAWRRDEQVAFGRRSGPGELMFEALEVGSYELAVGGAAAVRPGKNVLIARDGEQLQVTLQAPAAGELRGRVVDERGLPVPDAWVRAERSSALGPDTDLAPLMTMAGADGTFVLRGVAREDHDVRASGALGEGTARGVRPGAPLVIEVRRFGALSGVVRDRAGAPVPSFDLTVTGADGARTMRVSDEGGRWTVPSLAPGQWDVAARADELAAQAQVDLPPGGTSRSELTLAHQEPTPTNQNQQREKDQRP
jgi:hypothetical protein